MLTTGHGRLIFECGNAVGCLIKWILDYETTCFDFGVGGFGGRVDRLRESRWHAEQHRQRRFDRRRFGRIDWRGEWAGRRRGFDWRCRRRSRRSEERRVGEE